MGQIPNIASNTLLNPVCKRTKIGPDPGRPGNAANGDES